MANVSFDFHDEAKWYELAADIDDQHLLFEVQLDGYVFRVHWAHRTDGSSGYDFSAELAWSSMNAFEGKRYQTAEELIRETRKHIGQHVLEYEREEQLANETEVAKVVHLMERVALRRAGKAQWEARKRAERKALEDRERRGKLLDHLNRMYMCLACGHPMSEITIEEETISEPWNEEGLTCYTFRCQACRHQIYVSQDPQ